MGYTHYWKFRGDKLSQKSFNKIVKDVQKIEAYFQKNNIKSTNAGGLYGNDEDPFVKLFDNGGESYGVYYSGSMQNGKFTAKSFSFNGDDTGDRSFGHETFGMRVGENDWCFCKTARKPYDLAVTLVLLCVKYHLKSAKINSDGAVEEWSHAIELFNTIFPERNVVVFENDNGYQVARIPMVYTEDPSYKEKMQNIAYSPDEKNTKILEELLG